MCEYQFTPVNLIFQNCRRWPVFSCIVHLLPKHMFKANKLVFNIYWKNNKPTLLFGMAKWENMICKNK